jgi:hypothetical protein
VLLDPRFNSFLIKGVLVMRLFVFWMVCFCGLFLLTSCKEEPVAENYGVNRVTSALSDSDNKACFSAAGLEFERFEIVIPARTGIVFSSEQFENGQSAGRLSSGTLYIDKGLQKFILFKRWEGNEIRFSVYHSGSKMGCGSVNTDEFRGWTSGWIPVKALKASEKQPIIFMAANNGDSIEGFSTENFDLEVLIKKYDYATVIYASLKE